jgi:misacylated tRNA(Ala) deacylase
MAVAGPIPSIVGALTCQKDSYLRTLKTSVVSCVEYTPPKIEVKKGKKQKDAAQTTENGTSGPEKIFLIELADSVLFPEGMSFRYAVKRVIERLITVI